MNTAPRNAPDDDQSISAVLRASIEEIPEGFVVYDPDDRLVICNAAYRKLYALSAEAMVPGTRFEDILRYGLRRNQYPEAGATPREQETWLADRLAVHRAADRRVIQQIGPSRWLQIHERKLSSGHIVGVRSDISHLRRLETQNRWRGDVIDRSEHEMFIVDAQTGTFLYVNRGARKNLGYTSEELADLHPWDINAEFDRAGMETLFAPLLHGEVDNLRVDTVHRRRDGSTYPCHVTIHLDREGASDVFVGIAEDMTVQRALEDEIVLRRRDLETLLQNIPDAISRARPDTTLIYANDPYRKLLGRKDEDLIGRSFLDFVPTAHRDAIVRAIETLTPEAPIHHSVEKVIDPEGIPRTFRWSNLMVFEGSEPVEIVSAGRDVTDLVTMNDALSAANEELQSFAYAASHDLRSPIQTMRSLLDILEDDYLDALPEDARAVVARLSGVAARMVQLSNGVLDYARVSGAPVMPAPFDCASLLTGMIANLESEIAEAEAKIAVGPMPWLNAIKPQIGQVFQNLISNSLKFRHPDRPCEIAIAARKFGELHEFTISDNGIGLSEDDAESIFAPFRRLHGRHSFAGSGLGLTICRKIVVAHGGQIRAERRDGPGTRFIFTISEAPHV